MKQVRISHLLNCSLGAFLVKLGAGPNKIGYPQYVYISDDDAAVLKRNNRRKIRKEYPYLSKRKLDNVLGQSWLQYGPNSSLGKVIRPGYALVDVQSIKADEEHRLAPYEYKVTAVEAEYTWKDTLRKIITLNWI
jgi:hypothetical protein